MSLEELRIRFEELLESGNAEKLKSFLDDQNISDVADLVYECPEQESKIIESMSVHRAAGVFKILEFSTQKSIIQNLPPDKTAELLNELPDDDRTDFLEELPSGVVRELIKLLKPEERKSTLSLLGYPENSVGRLMTPDYVYVYENQTVAEVLSTIRRVGKNSETIDVIYVINDKGELLDDIRIREFILASPDQKVSELMDERFIALNADDDQEVANEVFKMNNRVALPVVSNSNKLLGIVTIDDILWVAGEEFGEDIQKIGGTEALEEPYLETPILKLFKKRVVWLIILFIGELMTISAMHYFEDEIAKVVVLATFIPLIISSGGNSGSQAATLIIQAMALKEISIADWWRIMRREIFSGLLLGITLCLLGMSMILTWHLLSGTLGQYYITLALTLGLSLVGVVLWGTLMGSMLPLILKKFGADPAASSTPFVATLVDVTGLVIYFSVALLTLSGKLL
ncbi:MAG: magnesium transporter [Chitinophagaceae bacterium]|nr:magnesium transporter [Chitinophagaceae bacterium]